VKNTFAFIIGALVLVAGGIYIVMGLQDRAEKAELWSAINEARTETARQLPIFIQAPDDKQGYDRQQFVRKHIDLMEAAYKAHPGAKPKEDDFINEMEAKAKEGKKDKAKAAEYRERFDYVKKIWNDYLKAGTYKPVLTAYDHGIRMDILEMKQSNDGGQQGVRMDVLFYGPVKDQFTAGPLSIKSAIEIPDEKHPNAKPKLGLVKVDGTATPYVLVDKPWEWIPEWPPGVMVGYYINLPLFHPKASKYSFEMSFSTRDQGGSVIPVDFKWKDLPVDPAIRGAPGSSWDAPVEAVDEEQLKEEGLGADDDKKKDDKEKDKDKKGK
jgi:hypothetical protein